MEIRQVMINVINNIDKRQGDTWLDVLRRVQRYSHLFLEIFIEANGLSDTFRLSGRNRYSILLVDLKNFMELLQRMTANDFRFEMSMAIATRIIFELEEGNPLTTLRDMERIYSSEDVVRLAAALAHDQALEYDYLLRCMILPPTRFVKDMYQNGYMAKYLNILPNNLKRKVSVKLGDMENGLEAVTQSSMYSYTCRDFPTYVDPSADATSEDSTTITMDIEGIAWTPTTMWEAYASTLHNTSSSLENSQYQHIKYQTAELSNNRVDISVKKEEWEEPQVELDFGIDWAKTPLPPKYTRQYNMTSEIYASINSMITSSLGIPSSILTGADRSEEAELSGLDSDILRQGEAMHRMMEEDRRLGALPNTEAHRLRWELPNAEEYSRRRGPSCDQVHVDSEEITEEVEAEPEEEGEQQLEAVCIPFYDSLGSRANFSEIVSREGRPFSYMVDCRNNTPGSEQ